MKNDILFSKKARKAMYICGAIFSLYLYSCSKSNAVDHPRRVYKKYKALVTWTGNSANFVDNPQTTDYDPPQSVSVFFQLRKDDTTSCCVQDKRESYSWAWVAFDNEDFLSYESLWAVTDRKDPIFAGAGNIANIMDIKVTNDETDTAHAKIIPPAVAVRIRVYPEDSQTPLLDTTVTVKEDPVFPIKLDTAETE